METIKNRIHPDEDGASQEKENHKTLVALLQEWVTLENQVPGCTHEYSSDLSRRTYAVLAQSAGASANGKGKRTVVKL